MNPGYDSLELNGNKQIEKANEALKTAKEVERIRKKNGWKWITKDRESKQVSPQRLKGYLKEGWRLSKRKK